MPQVGDEITPSIRLVRELGAGGMGSVWIADHRALQTQVVVKFMLAQLAADKDSSLRFTREAAAGANVKSPHVVQVLDHGIAPDGSPFIVMELLEGHDLGAHIEQNGALALAEVDVIVSQSCKALGRAHERGIIHRDIKPQNIFLTNSGGGDVFVKVLDFGIAKASDSTASAASTTKTGAMIGTPYYMSPEQVIGAKHLDHRTDLWALGVVAFECLTARKPFDAETVGGLAVNICSGPMPLPSSVNPGLPPAFDRWFARACARDLAQRFGSAKEMADALHLVVGGGPGDGRLAMSRPSAAFPPSPASVTLPEAQTAFQVTPAGAQGTEPVAALGLTTAAPVTDAESRSPAGVTKPQGRAAVVGIGAAVVLVLAGVAVTLANRSTDAKLSAGVQATDLGLSAVPSSLPAPSTAAAPSASVSAAAASAVAASPPLPPRPEKPTATSRANLGKPPSVPAPVVPAAAGSKAAAPAKSKDRDSIE